MSAKIHSLDPTPNASPDIHDGVREEPPFRPSMSISDRPSSEGTKKVRNLDDVRSEDQVFQAELWTFRNRLNTPEGAQEFLRKEREYEESIRTPLPVGFAIGLVPFAHHRLWCVLITTNVTSVRFLMEGGPASGPLSTEQIATTVFYDGSLESVMELYGNCRKKYPTLPPETNPLTIVRIVRGLQRSGVQPDDEVGIRRVIASVRKTEAAIAALKDVDLVARTSPPVVEV
jgi:hypothetical protein